MENNKRKDILMIFTFLTLALSLVSTITYMIYTIISDGTTLNYVISIFGVIILAIFSIALVVTGFFIENKTAKLFIIIASLLLTIYSIIQIIIGINTPKELLPNFINKNINEVTLWAKEKNINLIKEYAYSDDIERYHIISQDIKEGTKLRKIKDLKLVISNGIDTTKITKVDNMIGWKLDDVIKFIDDNKLTNVTIDFRFDNNVEKDVIISQDIIKEVTRNEPITLVCSLGRESNQKSVIMENLVGMDLFHATTFLKRNNIKYNIEYAYSDSTENIILKQSIKQYEVISPSRNVEVTLAVSKLDEVTIPDFSKMSVKEIDKWADNNKIIIEYEEEYNDTIKENTPITYNVIPGNTIIINSTIKITVSKGTLKMIKFTNVSNFEEWAKENDVSYNINYEFSDSIDRGKLISSSHKEGEIIKNNDTVKLVISDGGYTSIPNFIDLTQEEAKKACLDNNLTCTFSYLDNNIGYTKITKQSMRANSKVPNNTSITLTIGK